MGFALSLTLFAFSQLIVLSFTFLMLVGFCQIAERSMSNAAIQTDAPSNLLGRVLSLFFMDRGLWSLGGFLMGTAASAVGISWTFVGCAAICTLAAGSLLVANPSNRGLIDPRSGA